MRILERKDKQLKKHHDKINRKTVQKIETIWIFQHQKLCFRKQSIRIILKVELVNKM